MKNAPKRWLAIAGIAALLAGCSTGDDSAKEPLQTMVETTAAPLAPEAATSSPAADLSREKQVEAVFLKIVRKDNAGLNSAADADLIEMGKMICGLYKGGASGSEVNDLLFKGSGFVYTAKELASVNGSGVAAFCPEYMDKL